MRVFALAALALVLNFADGQPAAAQEDFMVFEVDDARLREIALAVAVEANVDKPARLRDVIGLQEGTSRLVCGHALVMDRNLMSMGYKPFAGFIASRDQTPPNGFQLVGYGYPIGPVDLGVYEFCEYFGFRL